VRRWAIVLVTILEIRLYECQVGCRFSGYDDGSYRKGNCLCIDKKPYFPFIKSKKLTIPRKSPGGQGKMEDFYERGPELHSDEEQLPF
jgi:hypothetical protein